MNYTEFANQIHSLMVRQQNKKEIYNSNSSTKYQWLSKPKIRKVIMTAGDDFSLFKAFEHVDEHQRIEVLRQLFKWLNENPNESAEKIPERCIQFLNRFHTINIIKEATLSRSSSIRNSLRRLSNRVAPSSLRGKPKPSIYFVST